MAVSAEYKSKCVALHRLWWRLQMSEKFSSGTKTPKQTYKQTNKKSSYYRVIIPSNHTLIFAIIEWVNEIETADRIKLIYRHGCLTSVIWKKFVPWLRGFGFIYKLYSFISVRVATMPPCVPWGALFDGVFHFLYHIKSVSKDNWYHTCLSQSYGFQCCTINSTWMKRIESCIGLLKVVKAHKYFLGSTSAVE